MKFTGSDYNPKIDGARLLKQHEVIRDLMLDGCARTLGEIAEATDYPEASISAQLRHLRKPKFGGYTVTKKRREPWSGLFEYQVLAPVQIVVKEFSFTNTWPSSFR